MTKPQPRFSTSFLTFSPFQAQHKQHKQQSHPHSKFTPGVQLEDDRFSKDTTPGALIQDPVPLERDCSSVRPRQQLSIHPTRCVRKSSVNMAADPRIARMGSRTSTPNPPPPPPPPPEPSTSTSTPPVAVDGPAEDTTSSTPTPSSSKLKFCTVCASNQNRSMEAHLKLAAAPGSYPVLSFGTGSQVRLPGPSITQPNVYNFNSTSYTQMYDELFSKDPRLYRNNGLLTMLERNKNLKWGPERFQDWVPGVPRLEHISKGDKGSKGTESGVVDVIITCEERCWDAVVDDLMNRDAPLNRPVHVFNIDIKDNHEEAYVGGKAILELADRLNETAEEERTLKGPDGWENGTGEARRGFDERVPEILATWQEKWPNLPALWTLAWF